jgi:hypothetical protein
VSSSITSSHRARPTDFPLSSRSLTSPSYTTAAASMLYTSLWS